MFGQRFGRRYVDHERSCSTNSISSAFVFFHVKYVYDCEKPAFASSVIIDGRVNASERNTVSGCFFRTSAISHSQNGTGFVCGLSTRNTVTPASHQRSDDVANRVPEALAVARVPVEVVDVLVALRRVLRVLERAVGPVLEPLGVLAASHGWSGEHWSARSSASSIPCAWSASTSVREVAPRRRDRGRSRRGRPRRRRSPTGCRRRRAPPARCCCGPCGSSCRSGGSAGGRGRRSRARRAPARTVATPASPPQERGKSSYHAPVRARSRSTSTSSGALFARAVAVGARRARRRARATRRRCPRRRAPRPRRALPARSA